MQRIYTTTTTKTGINGTIYRKKGETKYIRVGKITGWTLQLKQERIQATLQGGIEDFSGHQDWEVDVDGIFIDDVTKIGEVYLKLHSFEGTKVTYEGTGILQDFSPTNEPDKFSGKIMGNGRLEISET